jgi:hypothetical protein
MTHKLGACVLLAGCLVGCEEVTDPTGTSTSNSNSGSGSTATTGNLRVSADSYAHLWINGSYQGHGSLYLTLSPGSYLVQAKAHSDGHVCWETRTTVYAGKVSTVSNNAWCR